MSDSDSSSIFNIDELIKLNEAFALGVPIFVKVRQPIHFTMFSGKRLKEKLSIDEPIYEGSRLIDSDSGNSIMTAALKVMQKKQEFKEEGFLIFLLNQTDINLKEKRKIQDIDFDSINQYSIEKKINIFEQIKQILIELGNIGTKRIILTPEEEELIEKYCPYAFKVLGREIFEKYKHKELKRRLSSYKSIDLSAKGREKRITTN